MPKVIENVREKIIETAYNLFIQDGYEQVKTGLISRKCGIASGTLFNYFPTKWDLLREVLEKVKENGLEEFLNTLEENTGEYETIYLAVSGLFSIIDRIGKLGKDFFIYILSLEESELNAWQRKGEVSSKLIIKSFKKCFKELSERSEEELGLLVRSFQALVMTAYIPENKEQESRKHFVCRSFLAMVKDSKQYIKEG